MSLFSGAESRFAQTISQIAFVNPFLPERIELERKALGPDFVDRGSVWSFGIGPDYHHPNIIQLRDRSIRIAETARDRLAAGDRASEAEVALYEDLVSYILFYRVENAFQIAIQAGDGRVEKRPGLYEEFASRFRQFADLPGRTLPGGFEPAHVFACLFQIRRAFNHIFLNIIGSSPAAARLRAMVWQSIFTHDMRRYRRVLYGRMVDIATLVTGPSGTGKELVARAIGASLYIPYVESEKRFASDYRDAFHPLNLSALSPTLIESELFGHRRGAFTGALEDHAGWLEVCSPQGTVFLDEIGDVAETVQVKLLRVLQTRQFQRLGETSPRRFAGKVMAATNRDLGRAMQEGRFRADLYYRLCSDIICTPSLREQFRDSPGELRHLVEFVARGLVGEESDTVVDEVMSWVEASLGPDYAWPGNFRELEQCVRNILVRKEYTPRSGPDRGVREELIRGFLGGELTADEMLSRYCTVAFLRAGSYSEAARRLGLDRRTVRGRVDSDLLARLRDG
jgi:DNA-binding NtrC family response regulator